MKRVLASLALGLAACVPQVTTAAIMTDSCVPDGYDQAKLDALKAAGFEIADEAARQAFAKGIIACLASPDPAMRDGIAFEALSHMGRAKQLSPETMKAIVAELTPWLEAEDKDGFAAPFAVLVLSEMARADRVEPYLSDTELSQLLEKGRTWLIGVRDYRGFDDKEGWRHGVAHGSDLMLQLVLNPRVGREGLLAIRDAVATQIAPGGHSYIDGESARLVRPILSMAQRGVLSEKEWTDWLAAVSGPGELGSWEGAYASEAGLARVHNLTAFLSALYVNVTLDADTVDDVLKPGLEAALRGLP